MILCDGCGNVMNPPEDIVSMATLRFCMKGPRVKGTVVDVQVDYCDECEPLFLGALQQFAQDWKRPAEDSPTP